LDRDSARNVVRTEAYSLGEQRKWALSGQEKGIRETAAVASRLPYRNDPQRNVDAPNWGDTGYPIG